MKAFEYLNAIKLGANLGVKIGEDLAGLIGVDGPIYRNNNLDELSEIYDYEIDDLYVGWKYFSKVASEVKSLFVFTLPEFISKKNFNDASIFISGKYRDQEIFIEFGPYTGKGKGLT